MEEKSKRSSENLFSDDLLSAAKAQSVNLTILAIDTDSLFEP